MKVKVKQNGMLVDATIEMVGDMMVVIPITESRKKAIIKNGELITLIDTEGVRRVYMANCLSEQDGYKILHYHACIDEDGDFDESGQVVISTMRIEHPTSKEENTFYYQLADRGLIWDKENGWLTNFDAGMIVTCSWLNSKGESCEWVCACESIERESGTYFINEYCGTYLKKGSDKVFESWLEPDVSDAATSVRLATAREQKTLFSRLAAYNLKWDKQSLSLQRITNRKEG